MNRGEKSFNLVYIAYVSWSFENTLYETKISILTIISIYVQE